MGAGLRRPGAGDLAAGLKRLVPLGVVVAVSLVAAFVWAVPGVSSRSTPNVAAPRSPAGTAPLSAQAGDVSGGEVTAPAAPAAAPAPPPAPATTAAPVVAPPATAAIVSTVHAADTGHDVPSPNVTTVRYGPIPVLPALLGKPTPTIAGAPLVANLPLLPMPCANCYVTGTTIDMVYENGQSANLDTGVMLHHLVLFQPMVDDTTCARTTPIGFMGQRFFASGNERTPGALPAGYGVHFGGGPLGAFFEIMNHSDQLKVVYLTAQVSWLPDSTPGITAVTPVWLDQNNCSTSTFAIPAGTSESVWTWHSPLTGRFVTAGGHVHDGGVKTVLSNRSTGQQICSSVAGYGTKPAYMGSIETMSVCSWDRLGTVRRGETLALTTHYNSSVPQPDAMGIMIAYLYPTDDLEGGTPAPEGVTNPEANPNPPPPHMHH